MVARLRSARIAQRDLLSGFPKALGSLELDLATIFGFTPDSNITVSALALDNSGRVTKDLIFQKSTDVNNLGMGFSLENSSNDNRGAAMVQSTQSGHVFRVCTAHNDAYTIPAIFTIDMLTGALGGYTTQDLSSTPLIPATGGVSASNYYNGDGTFSVPGNSPAFDGVGLWAASTNSIAGATTNQSWQIAAPASGQVGWDYPDDHFSDSVDATKITIPRAGKYTIVVHIGVYCPNIDPQDVTLTLQKNGTTTIYSQTYSVKSNFGYLTIATVADLSAADFLRLQVGSGTAEDFTSGVDPGTVIAFPQTFAGRFLCYRME